MRPCRPYHQASPGCSVVIGSSETIASVVSIAGNRRGVRNAVRVPCRIVARGLHILRWRVKAVAGFAATDLFVDDGAFFAGVLNDLAQALQCATDDVHTDLLVRSPSPWRCTGSRAPLQHEPTLHRCRERYLLNCRARRVHGILNTSLFFHFGLGCGADPITANRRPTWRAALAISRSVGRVSSIRARNTLTGLRYPTVCRAFNDVVLSLVDRDLLGARVFELDVLEFDAEVFANHAAAGQDGNSSNIAFRRSPKPGALTSQCSACRAASSVHPGWPVLRLTSSAMINMGLPILHYSRIGSRSFIELIFS